MASRIDVPTLLIQGENDSLFGLDQANANYQAIKRNGAPVDMVWFAGGHDGGNQETARINELTQEWFDRWLMPPAPVAPRPARRSTAGQPAFAVSRNEGFDPSSEQELLGVATAPGYPGLRGTRQDAGRPARAAAARGQPGGRHAAVDVDLSRPGRAGRGERLGSAAGGGIVFDMPGQTAAFESAPLRTRCR